MVEPVFWSDPDRVPSFAERERITALTIGVFDGVHLGHQQLLNRARLLSAGGEPCVLTFDPNPARYFGADGYLGDITTIPLRARYIEHNGVANITVVQFSERFAALKGADFLTRIVAGFPRLRTIVIGYDFHLGRNRDLNPAGIANWLRGHEIRVDIVPALQDNNGPISSSRVRRAVAAGELERAASLLGRRFAIEIDGHQPLVKSECSQVLPPCGDYRCDVVGEGHSREGMMRISDTGVLNWEPLIMNTRYLILRSRLNGTNS